MYVYVYEYVCMYVCIAIVTFRSFHTKESELHPNIIHIYPDKVVSLLKFTSIIQQLIITCKHCNKNKNQIDRNKIELRRNTYYVCAYTVILHGHDCHDLTFTSRESFRCHQNCCHPGLLFMTDSDQIQTAQAQNIITGE